MSRIATALRRHADPGRQPRLLRILVGLLDLGVIESLLPDCIVRPSHTEERGKRTWRDSGIFWLSLPFLPCLRSSAYSWTRARRSPRDRQTGWPFGSWIRCRYR